MDHRPLGAAGIDVSVLSLGSWRTYERIPRERGLAVMRAARELGIDFLDDARYNDEAGDAPIPTGYSEVVFGELFRAAGWRRDEVAVANKLWFESWPEQSAEHELNESLKRMGFDYVDLIYACWPPPERPELTAAEIVDSVAGILRAGKARAWGFCNWEPALIVAACAIARQKGVPLPAAAQLPYNLGYRDAVEGEAARAALSDAGAGVVAAFSLAGGALTGKYSWGGAGRHSPELDDPDLQELVALGAQLANLATDTGMTAAALALAFALHGPGVASVLFGATTTEQLHENAKALEVGDDLLGPVRALA
jgi:aryl-alcohol dehydrogenase-like predicted oxidoreductase